MNNTGLSFNTALVFFSIGTLLLLIQIGISKVSLITIIGLYFVIGSTIINLILVLLLIIQLIFDNNKRSTIKCIGFLTLNIPIAAFYYFLVIKFFI